MISNPKGPPLGPGMYILSVDCHIRGVCHAMVFLSPCWSTDHSGGGKRQSGGKREELQTQLVDREKEVKSLQAKLEASHKEVCLQY